jgi:hypothetical protein
MTHQIFPLPKNEPLKRLNIYDGLLITADRWQKAHQYHRDRQNIHYQSIHQPMIVWGLGVRAIQPPQDEDKAVNDPDWKNIPKEYRDNRWLQIQPGLAIDLMGNPIRVKEPILFRIDTPAPQESEEEPSYKTKTVYLVLRYIEPRNPGQSNGNGAIPEIQEWYRIDERTDLPLPEEIELCRIVLSPTTGPNIIHLKNPKEVLFPKLNEIDLRYRLRAQARPEAVIRSALLQSDDENRDRAQQKSLSYLMQSVKALYPTLQGAPDIEIITTSNLNNTEKPIDIDLLYLTVEQCSSCDLVDSDSVDKISAALKAYKQSGGVILIEAASDHEIKEVKTVIDRTINPEVQSLTQSLKPTSEALSEQSTQDLNRLKDLLGSEILKPWSELDEQHPLNLLRTQPFLFVALPDVTASPLQLYVADGIIVVLGNLSASWGPDPEDKNCPRHKIRAAQEFGINILHFAWQRRQISGLLQPGA